MSPDQLSTSSNPLTDSGSTLGETALNVLDDDTWLQLYLEFADWTTAEQVAALHLAPFLNRAEAEGVATQWWFIRKHPCWRLRMQDNGVKGRIGAVLDELTTSGHLHRWWTGIYEPETAAFGNAHSMRIAHELFHADSRAILDLQRHNKIPLGRRELSVLLCGTLMRAAALEWYEQGDVWHRVAQERPLPDDVPQDRLQELADELRQLMLADTTSDGPLLGQDAPLAFAADWAGAFREAGTALGTASREGALDRGLRHVISYQVIFHWNRLGLPARKQSILAWAARAAILGLPAHKANAPTRTRPSAPAPTITDRVAARFPLVPRARLTCPDLGTRIAEACTYAHESTEQTNPEGRLERACSAWNLAALIAADCGMPGLAADLCWRQFQIFQKAWPVSGPTAIASLQPLVNLARLVGRAGNPDGAYEALHAMNHALNHGGGSAQIHGRSVSFDAFATTSSDRREAVPWLRTVLLEDGTRLLVATGQWTRAAAHAALCDDARDRLSDARQVQVLAHVHDGHTDLALTLLETGALTEQWERAVAACLRVYSDLRTARPRAASVAAMLDSVSDARQSLPGRGTTFFRFRLGLTAMELAAQAHPGREEALCTELIRDTAESGDAFTARELLRHETVRARMAPADTQQLDTVIHNAGLGRGTTPASLLSELMGAVETAEASLTQALNVRADR